MKKIEKLSAFHMFTNSYEEALDMWFESVVQSVGTICLMSLHEDFKDLRDIALEGVDRFIETAEEKISILMTEYVNIASDYKVVRSEENDAIFKNKAIGFKGRASGNLSKLNAESASNLFVLDGYNKQSAVVDYSHKSFVLKKMTKLDWVQFVVDMKNGNHPLE